MDSYSFYKSLYDRELNRRYTLDSAVNLPLTLFTIIVASNSYLLKGQKVIYKFNEFELKHFIMFLILLALLVTTYFLISSFNNFYKGFKYSFIGFTTGLRDYEIRVETYNNSVAEKLPTFEEKIIEKLTHFTDNHIRINDKRSKDLYYAKTAIIIALLLTMINFMIESYKYIQL